MDTRANKELWIPEETLLPEANKSLHKVLEKMKLHLKFGQTGQILLLDTFSNNNRMVRGD